MLAPIRRLLEWPHDEAALDGEPVDGDGPEQVIVGGSRRGIRHSSVDAEHPEAIGASPLSWQSVTRRIRAMQDCQSDQQIEERRIQEVP
jgi:hypothetical protein